MKTASAIIDTLSTVPYVSAESLDGDAVTVWVRADPYGRPSSVEIDLANSGSVGIEVACNAVDKLLDSAGRDIDQARQKLHNAKLTLIDMVAE